MEDRNVLNKLFDYLPQAIVIASIILMRVVPHPPNFAAVGALALFSGANLPKKQAFVLPVLVMLVSDLIIGFHSTMFFVYGSFLLISCIGLLLKKNISPLKLLITSISSSVLFFIITNFGVWAVQSMYPKTFQGLAQAYAMGIPFFRNTLSSDILFSFGFFYGYYVIREFAKRKSVTILSRK